MSVVDKERPLRESAIPGLDAPTSEKVAAVNAADSRPLYSKRVRIHPKAVDGFFRRAKWAFMAVLLGIYYIGPWIRWDRGPNAASQAILIDFPSRKFYFFFIEIWPQEVYYLTGILVLAALGLFFVTSLFGRIWCGFGCPQTVWTDLYIRVERMIEGDRNARLKLDKAPWTAGKIAKKVVKHAIWILIGMATGGAWIFYFADAPTLARDLVTLQAPAVAWTTIAFFTTATYVMAGFFREQVCTYMCPYARFQAAMFDEETFVVTYRADRGDPRGAHKKGDTWEGRGDCIDCTQCVAVCPVGIDIRDGQQLECISCGLCIDACNEVMDKVERPRGLIAFDTLANANARAEGKAHRTPIIRPRTIMYVCLMLVVSGLMLTSLVLRATLELNVIGERNPLYVLLSDGSLRNAYTLKVLNKAMREGRYTLSVDGLPNATLSVVGDEGKPAPTATITAPPDLVATYRVLVTVPKGTLAGNAADIRFHIQSIDTDEAAMRRAIFRGP
jgi:cytochrome c oxidase accessory protein FixG